MNDFFRIGLVIVLVGCAGPARGSAQAPASSAPPPAPCASGERPYRDFDFILGTWEFRSPDGTKIGDQVITRRGGGCVIVEEWTEVSGLTGLGMSFVDPRTGRWRQVWVSSRFHIDYAGGLDESGAMVLEGTMHPASGGPSSRVRGLWTRQADGSLKKEFQMFDENENRWKTFFSGFAFPQSATSA